MDIQKLPIDQLIPAKYNPRKDLKPGDPAYEKLKRSIEEFGYVEPVILNKQTGNVVGGHQRIKVLKQMGFQEVDCVVVDLGIEKEKALNLTMNKVTGEWDIPLLTDLLRELESKASDILEGRKTDPTFYPTIYAASETDDWTKPETWRKANPSLGVTFSEEKLAIACENARQNPAEENSFKQLRLCIWVKQSIRWMQMEKWDHCAFPVDPDELLGRVCYGGLDLSSSTDLTAFVLVFPPVDETDKFQVLPFFWMPEENISTRVKRDHVPYDTWESQGFVKTTEGNVVHYGFIESFIEELNTRYNIREIAFDRWGAVQMTQNLEGLGFTVVPFGQGFKDMSPPTKELMKLTLERKIAHSGHPVLRWCMDNIFVRTDPAGNIKPDKEKSTEKIDGAVALVMALDRAIRNGGRTGTSVYEDRGLLIL